VAGAAVWLVRNRVLGKRWSIAVFLPKEDVRPQKGNAGGWLRGLWRSHLQCSACPRSRMALFGASPRRAVGRLRARVRRARGWTDAGRRCLCWSVRPWPGGTGSPMAGWC